jgi:hypothetical protein
VSSPRCAFCCLEHEAIELSGAAAEILGQCLRGHGRAFTPVGSCVAPNEPVLSTAIACTSPCPRIQVRSAW